MKIEPILEKWTGEIFTVKIGATSKEGGTRRYTLQTGGEKGLPFLFKETPIYPSPLIAGEIWDIAPLDWPDALKKELEDVFSSGLDWAKEMIKAGADLICLRLKGAHPEEKALSLEEETKFLETLLKNIDIPLIILGCDDTEKDNLLLPRCSEITRGERCLLGEATQENYKTLTASWIADGHNIIAQSPIDINIAKQLNILITDMGLPLERIVMNPTIGALGYGLEYAYSIMERARLASLTGDKMMSSPFICFVGQEAWRAKEAKASEQEAPNWGDPQNRGILWEVLTATVLLQAGADILVMRHPQAIRILKRHIQALMSK